MGCDIHLHIEVKVNGKWEHWSAPNVNRSYRLFALMAGVRNYYEIAPVAQPKGFPEDASALTKFDYENWGADAHSTSWLSGEELDLLDSRLKETLQPDDQYMGLEGDVFHTYVFGNGFNVKKYPGDYPVGVEDCRAVFWFDN